MIDYFCNGVGEYAVCFPVEKIFNTKLKESFIKEKMPKEYKNWIIEKYGFSLNDYKYYIQVRYQHIIKTLVI